MFALRWRSGGSAGAAAETPASSSEKEGVSPRPTLGLDSQTQHSDAATAGVHRIPCALPSFPVLRRDTTATVLSPATLGFSATATHSWELLEQPHGSHPAAEPDAACLAGCLCPPSPCLTSPRDGESGGPLPMLAHPTRLTTTLSAASAEWSLITSPEDTSPSVTAAPAFSRADTAATADTTQESTGAAGRATLAGAMPGPATPPHSHAGGLDGFLTYVPSASSLGSFEEIKMEDVVAPPSPPQHQLLATEQEPPSEQLPESPTPPSAPPPPQVVLATATAEPVINEASDTKNGTYAAQRPESVLVLPAALSSALGNVCRDVAWHWYGQLRVVLGQRQRCPWPDGSANAALLRRRRRRGDKERQSHHKRWMLPLGCCLRPILTKRQGPRGSGDEVARGTRSGWPASSLDMTADIVACVLHGLLILLL